jgi:hypothetical protein
MSWLHHVNRSPFMHSLNHAREEPESEVQVEQALVEATNPELAQGKPRYIPQMILFFYFESLLYNKLDCALSS